MTRFSLDDVRIAVIGLGYVGLPLAVCMASKFPVLGFDVDEKRISDLRKGVDGTGEVTPEEFAAVGQLNYSADGQDLADCNFYIVTVPTPIDESKRPDFTALLAASRTVGSQISPGDVVVYESTVYPGATDEVCIPEIERISGLSYNTDFFAGYSPERINPGDMSHRLPDIKKVTSGSTPETAEFVDKVYASIITAGTHKVGSLRVAEAAKVIENIQRDVNIALINELAMLFKKLGLETSEVLEAAGTKWNFHGYRPGLVGGHCIGVDPYYLTHKAQSIGFHPEMILAGRRINDGMAAYVAQDIIKVMLKRAISVDDARILIMGFTFKENCPDLRNTKIADLVRELETYAGKVEIYDPLASPAESLEEYGIRLENEIPDGEFDMIVLAVKHKDIVQMEASHFKERLKPGGLIYDITGLLPPEASDARL